MNDAMIAAGANLLENEMSLALVETNDKISFDARIVAERIYYAMCDADLKLNRSLFGSMSTYSLPFVEHQAKRHGCRVVKEDRIKTIASCSTVNAVSRVPEAERKIAYERMAKNIGESIAERLLTFDKMRIVEYGDEDAPPHLQPAEAMIMARFDVIVPEGKPGK